VQRAIGKQFNFAQHVIDLNAARRSKIAFVDDHTELRYAELALAIRQFASGLRRLDVRREERILLLLLDSTDWPIAFLGSLYGGVVPVPVNTLLTPDDYAYILAHSRAQAVFVSQELLPKLQAALANSSHEVRKVVVSRAPEGHQPEALSFAQFIKCETALDAPANTAADDIGFWLYSSGSTGRPKAVVHTQANLYWTAELFGKRVLGITEHDICFSAAKLFFAYGLGNALTFPLSVGATTVLMSERATPEAVFKRWIEKKVSLYSGVPTGYAGMLASPDLPKKDDVALRLCVSAGEALPRELGERFSASPAETQSRNATSSFFGRSGEASIPA